MSNLLKKLEERIEAKVQERIGVLEPKLDRMIYLLERINAKLERIEENTRK